MADATDLTDAIVAAAAAPKSAEADGVKVEATPIPDLIAADQYLKSKEAGKRKSRGLRFTRLIPPGAT